MTSSFGVAALLLLTLSVSAGLTLRLSRSPMLLDHPNERSLHRAPVPRTGGLAVLAALGCALALSLTFLAPGREWLWVAAAALLVALISFLDDRGEVKPLFRLLAHLSSALLLVAGGVLWDRVELPGLSWVLPAAIAVPLTLLFVTWMINLYNFMDGMDGLAGGMAVLGFSSLAVIGWETDLSYALTNAACAAAAGGFLVGNFPPARIFLGDLGSAVLGLLAAASILVGARHGFFPLWAGLLVFSPFIVDATWTLLRRLMRGEPVWQAHRSHFYQRLVLAGWSHRRTVLWSYLVMGACGATAVASLDMSERDQGLVLAAWAIIYAAIGLRVRLAERAAGIARG